MTYKVLITGGSGALGKELIKYCTETNINHFSPTSVLCNILDINSLKSVIEDYNPTHIIHAAAFVDTVGCEKNPIKSIDTNIIGTTNIVKCCNEKIKLSYISSEYVFSGNKGLYHIEDRLDPINIYGKTKAASEYIISIAPSYQILRVPFIRKIHQQVFDDQYCSRYFIEDVSEKIIKNVLYNSEKIVHISRNRMKLCDLYREKNIPFKQISILNEMKSIIPKDTSLINTNKYE